MYANVLFSKIERKWYYLHEAAIYYDGILQRNYCINSVLKDEIKEC
jgi:hypothetical protein